MYKMPFVEIPKNVPYTKVMKSAPARFKSAVMKFAPPPMSAIKKRVVAFIPN